MLDSLIIVIALFCGLASRSLGLPALIGYLGAGFLLHELDLYSGELLQTLADLGITLLLFTIGLKLQPLELLKARIWGTALIHMTAMQLIFMATLWSLHSFLPSLGLSTGPILIIAFALTFSSTVYVIQTLQEKGEMTSLHANLAIGILIIQDLAAVCFLTFSTGKIPEPTALLLLLLWPLRRPMQQLLSRAGHGELFTLFGFALALGGAQLFELTGLKGDLGALIIGALLAGSQKAKELARNLLQFKDLFLVGFFLSIGLGGWPQQEILLLAIGLGLLALLKPLLYFPIMTRLHVSPRTALLSSAALTNHSEFGLIVVAIAASANWLSPQWTSAFSVSIAVSFLLAPVINARGHDFYLKHRQRLLKFETSRVRAAVPDTRNTRIIVLGMGNIGTGAYEAMASEHGEWVLGVDNSDRKLANHREQHRRVVAADATDPEFWLRIDLQQIQLVMLALTNHKENMLVGHLLSELGYQGKIAAVIRFAEEAAELEENGISAFNLYAQAGAGFASHAAHNLPDTVGAGQPKT
jgi:predicted Kef-type K+ transport protein